MYFFGKAITLRWFLTSALFRLWKIVKSSNSAFLPCSPWHVSTLFALALHLNSPYGAVFISQRKSPPELGERGNPLLIFPKNLAWTGRNVLNPGQRDTFQNSWKQIQTDWSFQRKQKVGEVTQSVWNNWQIQKFNGIKEGRGGRGKLPDKGASISVDMQPKTTWRLDQIGYYLFIRVLWELCDWKLNCLDG